MPPAEIDPFALPGRIQGRAPPIRTEDMSSDDEMGERLLEKGRNAALHQRAAGAAPSGSDGRGRGARGGRRGGKASKAADHVLAAPLAVPGGPAPKRGSPAERQLREAPEKSKRRRSLSGDVSAAPAAASSAALPSGAAPSDDTLQQMMQKRASRKAPAAAPAASPQDDSVVLVSPAVQISPDGPPRQSPPRESPVVLYRDTNVFVPAPPGVFLPGHKHRGEPGDNTGTEAYRLHSQTSHDLNSHELEARELAPAAGPRRRRPS